jgi:hypothetical protein
MGKRARRLVLLAVGGAVALVAAACGPPPPPTPNADYQFYAFEGEQPKSCTATPGPRLVPVTVGAGSRTPGVESVDGFNDNVVAFTQGAGYNLEPTTGELGNTAYSIVVLFRLSYLSTFRSHDRLIDFKDGNSDNGVYLLNGSLRFYPHTRGGSRVIGDGEWAQVVITRAAGGTLRGFVDGVQQWEFTDSSGDGIISSFNSLTFFQDNHIDGLTDEHSAGAVARIRVFDRPLSQTEINNLGQTPGSPCTG